MEEAVWHLDAVAQAELVRPGEVSAVELVDAALSRAEALVDLNAVTTLFADRARERGAGASGPFAGVPIMVKDAGQELAGTPLWMGTTVLKEAGYVSVVTTELVGRLESLGFVVIGKAAVPELMTGISTEPPIGPPARNPWAPDRTVGGSSGGSAAAVAAGIVPVAHGSDSTGSLRYPASCCGVLTLKPSAGRIPSRLPAGLANPGNSHADFVLARSARDLHSIFASVASPSGLPAASIRRVGRLASMPFGLPVDPLIEDALDQVSVELVAIGVPVESIEPAFLEAYGAVLGRVIPTIVDAHRRDVVSWIEAQVGRPVTDGDLSPSIIEAARQGRRQEPVAVGTAWAELGDAAAVANAWTGSVDALLLPILDVPPWPIGTPGPDGALAGLLCSLANLTGQPTAPTPTSRATSPTMPSPITRLSRTSILPLTPSSLRWRSPTSSTASASRRSTSGA